MPFNPNNPKHIRQFKHELRDDDRALKPFREHRFDALCEMVGRYYSDTEAPERVPVGLLKMFVNTCARHLVARSPQYLVTAKYRALKPDASDMELLMNHLVRTEIPLEDELRTCVEEAIVCLGVMVCGLKIGTSEVQISGEVQRGTVPFVRCVHMDDFIFDVGRDIRESWYFSHGYRMRYEAFKENDAFSKKARDTVKPSGETKSDDETRAERLQGDDSASDDYDQFINLRDVYCPEEGRLFTIVDEFTGADVSLREVDWDGPATGMYRFLYFDQVLGNAMPLPPVAGLRDAHDMTNQLYVHLAQQAQRQKDVTVATGAAKTDADRIKKAQDGEIVIVDRPNEVDTKSFGGVDPKSMAFYVESKELFNYIGFNMNLIAGLGTQSPTATQDNLLSQNANLLINDMQSRVMKLARGIGGDIGWYIKSDPTMRRLLMKPVKATGDSIPVEVVPADMRAAQMDLQYDIEPYSMVHQTPAQKAQALTQLMTQVIVPMAPMLQQMGQQVDLSAFLASISKLYNLPELNDIVVQSDSELPYDDPPPSGSHERTLPTTTTRNYVRRNVPQATTQGNNAVLKQLLLGSGLQRGQTNKLGTL